MVPRIKERKQLFDPGHFLYAGLHLPQREYNDSSGTKKARSETMNDKVKRYFQLKQKQKGIEQELSELREDIILQCSNLAITNLEVGHYSVKIINQERKEYDDQLLYKALPDPDLWRMVSKSDPTKIASLIKLNVISEEILQGTFTVKKINLLQVEKK
jgi:hypothetical protein